MKGSGYPGYMSIVCVRQVMIAVIAALAVLMTAVAQTPDTSWKDTFDEMKQCRLSAIGSNPYFVLQPGHQVILGRQDPQTALYIVIDVLDETEVVDGQVTRVVRETEYDEGKLIEISRNFYVICEQTKDVYYFGEDVDVYENGVVVAHPGQWRSGENNARAGLMMPGEPVAGYCFYQEIAPDVAMDRAEIVSTDESLTTEAGTFTQCVKVDETTPLEPGVSRKLWAPGVGLVQDGRAKCIMYGAAKPGTYGHAEILIRADQLPEAVSAVVKQRFPDGVVEEAKAQLREYEVVYALAIVSGGRRHNVDMTVDGTVVRGDHMPVKQRPNRQPDRGRSTTQGVILETGQDRRPAADGVMRCDFRGRIHTGADATGSFGLILVR